MNRFRTIVAEAVRSLGANLSTTFAATTTVLIGMFMLGLVVGLGSWALSLSDHYKKQLLVNVYFCTQNRCGSDATTKQINTVHNALVAMPQVKSVRFVTKAEALRQERKKHPAMVAALPYNPFPDAFKIFPKQAEQIERKRKRAEFMMSQQSGNGDSSGAAQPVKREGSKVGRNDPCPCGSGKKFKKCHGVNA